MDAAISPPFRVGKARLWGGALPFVKNEGFLLPPPAPQAHTK